MWLSKIMVPEYIVSNIQQSLYKYLRLEKIDIRLLEMNRQFYFYLIMVEFSEALPRKNRSMYDLLINDFLW